MRLITLRLFSGFVPSLTFVAACGVNVVPNDSNDGGSGGSGATASGAAGGEGANGGNGVTASVTTTSVTTTSTTSSTSVTASSTSTGMFGDGNDSFATAVDVDISSGGALIADDIFDINDDVDYFRFSGVQGQKIVIAVVAHTGPDGQSPDFIDSVVTLYNANQTKIAFNDDPFPRQSRQDSELFTVLPSTGDFFVSVEDYHRFDPGASQPVTPPDGTYELYIGDINPDVLVSEPFPPNDLSTTASPFGFTMVNGVYQQRILGGTYPAGDSVDWYSFTVPSNIVTPVTSRPIAYLAFAPGTADGSGSTSELFSAELIDASSSAVIGRVDPVLETADKRSSTFWDREIYVPVVAGANYFLKLTRNGAGGANDFYFTAINADVDSNPLETAEIANNAPATAESLAMIDNAGVLQGFVEGNLAISDLDHFRVTTGGKTKVGVFCSAQSTGSGLRGFKATVFRGNGTTPLVNGTATELQDAGIEIAGPMSAGLPIPVGETSLVVKLEATGQDATVTSTAYHCGITVFD
jgi:hypothetical protein